MIDFLEALLFFFLGKMETVARRRSAALLSALGLGHVGEYAPFGRVGLGALRATCPHPQALHLILRAKSQLICFKCARMALRATFSCIGQEKVRKSFRVEWRADLGFCVSLLFGAGDRSLVVAEGALGDGVLVLFAPFLLGGDSAVPVAFLVVVVEVGSDRQCVCGIGLDFLCWVSHFVDGVDFFGDDDAVGTLCDGCDVPSDVAFPEGFVNGFSGVGGSACGLKR